MIAIDIDMPDSCAHCPCNNDYINCGVTGKGFYEDDGEEPLDERPKWCPLVEI